MNGMRTGQFLRCFGQLGVLLNLGYFGAKFTLALAISFVSLFIDTINFLEDALVNYLLFTALGWNCASDQ